MKHAVVISVLFTSLWLSALSLKEDLYTPEGVFL